jgi:hypothetical protein
MCILEMHKIKSVCNRIYMYIIYTIYGLSLLAFIHFLITAPKGYQDDERGFVITRPALTYRQRFVHLKYAVRARLNRARPTSAEGTSNASSCDRRAVKRTDQMRA